MEGDATGLRISDCLAINFYPRPPGGGRLHGLCNSDAVRLVISIHALRVEGDSDSGNYYPIGKPISIHALRVEGDARRCFDM